MAQRTMWKPKTSMSEEDQIRTGTFMGPSPGGAVVNRTMERPRAGTMGIPETVSGGRNPVTGDLSVEARAALDQGSFRRKDPMAMTGIAGMHPARRAGTMAGPAVARPTTNPNARPVGRSSMDPDRIAERMYRQGKDPRFLMQRAAMREGQDFSREMFDATQAATDMRQQQHFQREDQMFERGQEAEANRDAREWNQSMTMFDMESHRREGESEVDYQRRLDLMREEAGLNSVVGMEAMEVPGSGGGYVPMARTQGGAVRPMGGFMPAPQAAPENLTPEQAATMGLEITGWANGRPQYGRRREQSTPIMTTDELGRPKSVIEIPEGYEWDPKSKQLKLKPTPGAGPQLRTSGAGVFGNR